MNEQEYARHRKTWKDLETHLRGFFPEVFNIPAALDFLEAKEREMESREKGFRHVEEEKARLEKLLPPLRSEESTLRQSVSGLKAERDRVKQEHREFEQRVSGFKAREAELEEREALLTARMRKWENFMSEQKVGS